MSIRAAAPSPQPKKDARLQAPISTFPCTLPPDPRDLMLLSSSSFAENFNLISAYCTAQKHICDMAIWWRLIAQHSVPLKYIDVYKGVENMIIVSINDLSTAEDVANYLQIVAKSVQSPQQGLKFIKGILENAPYFADGPNELPRPTGDFPQFLNALGSLAARQDDIYAVQLKTLEFVILQHGNILNIEDSSNRYVVKNSLTNAVLNYNMEFLQFIWKNFVTTPEIFRNGDLGMNFYKAVSGSGTSNYVKMKWKYKCAGYQVVINWYSSIWFVSSGVNLTTKQNESVLQNRLQHALVAVWALEHVIQNNFRLEKSYMENEVRQMLVNAHKVVEAVRSDAFVLLDGAR